MLKLIILAVLCAFLGCGSPTKFAKNSNKGDPSTENQQIPTGAGINGAVKMACSDNSVSVPIKILFVIDTSASNALAYFGAQRECDGNPGCVPATDPDKNLRTYLITEFLKKYNDKPNYSWGLEVFSKDDAKILMGESLSNVFGQTEEMQTAISAFRAEPDMGRTPYLKALQQVRTIVAHDTDFRTPTTVPALYYVVFMSDGYPTDSKLPEITSEIEKIIALSPTRVSLSTIYYGTKSDPDAADLLKFMSQVGNGQFVDVHTTKPDTFTIQDLVKLPSTCTN